jgi:uncharacterized protein YlxW (UPF0749 family)
VNNRAQKVVTRKLHRPAIPSQLIWWTFTVCYNQEIDKLATIPQSWSGERQEVAEDLSLRQEQPKKRGMIKRIVPEMRDLDLTISTMESERETTHEDGGPAGPTMR